MLVLLSILHDIQHILKTIIRVQSVRSIRYFVSSKMIINLSKMPSTMKTRILIINVSHIHGRPPQGVTYLLKRIFCTCPKNLKAILDELKVRFHQDIPIPSRRRLWGKWNASMLAKYYWSRDARTTLAFLLFQRSKKKNTLIHATHFEQKLPKTYIWTKITVKAATYLY